ncbi:MAG TPA: 2-dehydropantoate 2-reductase N-terminal domain-containing protein, partial [Clostridia bacterium]|nr:2-dehydropantoate 2-reductase N-terminal domain-containing protein [Clostridia bacterium]
MNITVIGAGNSGLAMAAHLSEEGHQVTLWNRSKSHISKLMETHTIIYKGVMEGKVKIHQVTDDIKKAIENPDIILITTPANSHKELAKRIGENIKKETLIVLNPGRTFGAWEFKVTYDVCNPLVKQTVAETQTIIYTCRKTAEDTVDIISFKSDVLISTFQASENKKIIARLPECIQHYFILAKSMTETSIG